MSDLSPSQVACNRVIENLTQIIGTVNVLSKYDSADSLETILQVAQDQFLAANAQMAKIEAFAAEAREKRLKAFGG